VSRFGVIIRSGGAVAAKVLKFGCGLAEAFALEPEPLGVVHEAIEDGVCEGGVADDIVPVLDGQLSNLDTPSFFPMHRII
jgi:hypothetical protein